ncbi:Non-specific serine/threonine protein kinase [Handroanthus impetiginosus]|uniref:Non-specific serine/threonine protein kinase n=1 Tax=Handroanthus impetiginosus TaxID=429701 RepID=A0A2G9HV22_9LAMI|nr:Non-specific serine/threonine protein kinase [Handroanthus impetiginosus]
MIPMKLLIGILLIVIFSAADGRCSRGCDVALASYYVWQGANLSFISSITQNSIPSILSYNPQIPNQDVVLADTRINVPFRCECLNGSKYLGHLFTYTSSPGVTYNLIAGTYYSNLTTAQWMERNNNYPASNIPDTGVPLNVPVNCSCGDSDVSEDYGLFVTYPLRPGESLESVASTSNLTTDLVRRYNPTANFSAGSGLVYIPGTGLSTGAIAGISVAGIVGALLFAGCLYVGFRRKKNVQKIQLLEQAGDAPEGTTIKAPDSAGTQDGGLRGITVDKSVEFSYEELANATNNFSLANKIGEGGFGAVYYAELRGEKAAIKKMDMQASKEFLAELKVLTRVHHLNLVLHYILQQTHCLSL